jgi:two-component sensor histidine kinase
MQSGWRASAATRQMPAGLMRDYSGGGVLSASVSTHEVEFQFPSLHELESDTRAQQQFDVLTAELRISKMREDTLRRKIHDLSRLQNMRLAEVEHRLFNGLQRIASLLSLQTRTASPEAAAELTIAVSRIQTLGNVHRRLHLVDHQEGVEFKQYLHCLCRDLSSLLLTESSGRTIVVDAASLRLPSEIAVPLGFILTELITNAAKHATGDITVRFETTSSGHSLIVSDDGSGLPAGFDPANSKGLGTKIILSYVNYIGGELHISNGDNGCGSRFAVRFGRGELGLTRDWESNATTYDWPNSLILDATP